MTEGQGLGDWTVVGINGETNGICQDTVNKKADISLGGIILRHVGLVVVQTYMERAGVVWMRQQRVRNQRQLLDCCRVIGRTRHQQETHIQVFACPTHPKTFEFDRVRPQFLVERRKRMNTWTWHLSDRKNISLQFS